MRNNRFLPELVLGILVAATGIILAVSWYAYATWSPSFSPQDMQKNYSKDQLQFVSGTEYFPGQEGQISVLITNAVGAVVTATYNCNYTILYPAKSLFAQGNLSSNTSIGTLWTNFTVPNTEGVYEYSSTCTKPGSQSTASKSFHVTKKSIRAVIPK
jgi:hypothetical protein